MPRLSGDPPLITTPDMTICNYSSEELIPAVSGMKRATDTFGSLAE
jgi:hypothetical protein